MELDDWAIIIHQTAVDKGFWDDPRNMGEMIALMHSELSEALESHRSGEPPVWYKHDQDCPVWGDDVGGSPDYPVRGLQQSCTCGGGKPEGWATEMVDCMIRIMDTLGEADIPIDDIVRIKTSFNTTRPYKHGRQY